MIKIGVCFCLMVLALVEIRVLHVFKLIDTPFGVAFTDFPQRLVLVTTLPDIFLVDPIHCRLSSLISGVRQILLQRLQLVLESLIPFCQCQTLLNGVLDILLKKVS